ncbi:hypothetical protein PDN31_25525 [Bacillus cereus]|nr:hypothetical protein [Bacillus cereus]
MRNESRQVNRVYTYGTLTKQGMALTVKQNVDTCLSYVLRLFFNVAT